MGAEVERIVAGALRWRARHVLQRVIGNIISQDVFLVPIVRHYFIHGAAPCPCGDFGHKYRVRRSVLM